MSNNGPSESTVFSFTTDATADLDSPEISNVLFEPADEEAVITWTTNELADSFIDFGTTSGLLDVAVGSVEDVLEHEVILTNLTAGTTYFFTAGSIDRANNPAAASAELSFATLDAADQTPPAAPANLAGTSGNAQALLSWDANTELDFASYTLSRRLTRRGRFRGHRLGASGGKLHRSGARQRPELRLRSPTPWGPHRQHLGGLERLLRHPHSHHGALAGQ